MDKQTQHYSIFINAPIQKVWDLMISEETYPKWTQPFNPGGSRFEGKWEEGQKMLFIGPDPETGEEGGMVSMIEKIEPNKFISIKHIGIVMNGVEDTEGEEVKKWAPSYENYTFIEKDGGTELQIAMDIAPDHVEMFNDMWPKALQKLKEMAEE